MRPVGCKLYKSSYNRRYQLFRCANASFYCRFELIWDQGTHLPVVWLCNQILPGRPNYPFVRGMILLAAKLAIEFNGKTTERFVEKAAFYGCKRFFYLSTVHVYKSPLVGRFNEKSENLNSHPYATSHLLGEQALIRHVKKSPMQGHVLRLSNCFGYPLTQDSNCWELVLNEFIRDAYKLGK